MGELKIIIWVVLGIIYLVSRARKKQVPNPESTTVPQEDYKEDRPTSFEDLLREIQATKVPKPQPVLRPTQELNTIDYDEVTEKKPLEDTNYNNRDHDTIYETYEKAKQEAFFRPSMEETLKLENTDMRFGEFKGYEQLEKENLAAVYVKELKDPTTFKKAFILSEILNRKF